VLVRVAATSVNPIDYKRRPVNERFLSHDFSGLIGVDLAVRW